MASMMDRLTGNRGRAVAGGALVAEGLFGIDRPFGRSRAGIFGSLVILLIGVVCAGAGFLWHEQHEPYPNGISTTGTVSGVQQSRSHKGKVSYSRVFTFTTSNGQKVSVTEPEASSTRPDLGVSVEVSYLKPDPGSARIIPAHDWLPYSIMAAGVLAALIGLGTFVVRLITLIFGIRVLSRAMRERRASANDAMSPPGRHISK